MGDPYLVLVPAFLALEFTGPADDRLRALVLGRPQVRPTLRQGAGGHG